MKKLTRKRVHREVMGWLKEWDKCVFKRANPVKKRRFNDNDDEEDPYVRLYMLFRLILGRLPTQTEREGTFVSSWEKEAMLIYR